MFAVLPILIALAVFLTLGALAFGVFTMARGGQANARNSNRLMRARVILQFIAITLILIAFLVSSD